MKECMIILISISISISKIITFLTSTYYIYNKSLASNGDFGLFKMCIRISVLDGFLQACLRWTDLVVSIFHLRAVYFISVSEYSLYSILYILLLGTKRTVRQVFWFSRSSMAKFACHVRRIQGGLQWSLGNPDAGNSDP